MKNGSCFLRNSEFEGSDDEDEEVEFSSGHNRLVGCSQETGSKDLIFLETGFLSLDGGQTGRKIRYIHKN